MEQEKKNNQKPGFFALCLKEFKFCSIAVMTYILVSCFLCWKFGYSHSPEEVTFIKGIPAWAVYGVFIPWIITVIITTIYGFFIMEGDDK